MTLPSGLYIHEKEMTILETRLKVRSCWFRDNTLTPSISTYSTSSRIPLSDFCSNLLERDGFFLASLQLTNWECVND